jgi:HEAT repeat protein
VILLESYVLYSIIIFSSFIFLLYIYLLYEKIVENFELNRRKVYENEVTTFIDHLINELENRDITENEVSRLKTMAHNKIKRKIIIERIILYNEIFSGEIRNRITELCEKSGIINYEIKNLKAKESYKVALACKTLGEFRSRLAIRALLRLSSHKSMDVRYHMVMALSKIGDVEAVVQAFKGLKHRMPFSERSLTEIVDSFEGNKLELYKIMIDSNNAYISTIFIKSAGNYMDAELNEYIKRFIDDHNKERKIAAIKAIGQNSDNRFLGDIIEKLKDSEWEVKAAAAKSLGRIGDKRALKPLLMALSDTSWWVRFNAANSIISIPEGTAVLEDIFKSNDKFSKDIIIAALEDSGLIQDIFLYENSEDLNMRKLVSNIREYMIGKGN